MPTLRKIKRAAMQPHKPTQIAAHLILPNRTQSPPTTRQVDNGKLKCNFSQQQCFKNYLYDQIIK
jgi:hypothetical protein